MEVTEDLENMVENVAHFKKIVYENDFILEKLEELNITEIVLVIKSVDGFFDLNSHKNIKEEIVKHAKVSHAISDIRISNNNFITVFVSEILAAKNLLKIKSIIDKKVSVYIHQNCYTCKFIVKNVEKSLSLEEIENSIKTSGVNPTYIKRFSAKQGNDFFITRTIQLNIIGKSIPEEVKIFYTKYATTLYQEKIIKCNNCYSFGHRKNFCNKKTSCGNCGKLQHEGVCEAFCKNCKESVPTSHNDCSAINIEKEILKIKNTENLSRFQAVKKYNLNKRSYAEVLNHNSIPKNNNSNNNYINISDIDRDISSTSCSGYKCVNVSELINNDNYVKFIKQIVSESVNDKCSEAFKNLEHSVKTSFSQYKNSIDTHLNTEISTVSSKLDKQLNEKINLLDTKINSLDLKINGLEIQNTLLFSKLNELGNELLSNLSKLQEKKSVNYLDTLENKNLSARKSDFSNSNAAEDNIIIDNKRINLDNESEIDNFKDPSEVSIGKINNTDSVSKKKGGDSPSPKGKNKKKKV